jgi:amino acid permease
MLPTFFGRHDDPWWLSRPAVLAALMLGVVAPTLVPRSLRAVAKFSSFSVCMLFVLATSIASLAAVALATGKVAPGVRLLPDAAVLGPSPLEAAANVLSIVSVSALAFTCQFNLLPIQKSLREPGLGSMRRVLLLGLALCAALYTTVAISGAQIVSSC